VQIIKLLIMQFSRPPCQFIPLRSKYSPLHPVLNTLSLCSSFDVRDQVSHAYRITGKIIVFYILILTFLSSWQEEKSSGLNDSKNYQNWISSWIKFGFVNVAPKTFVLWHFLKWSVCNFYVLILTWFL
jgi:hypothetical protein